MNNTTKTALIVAAVVLFLLWKTDTNTALMDIENLGDIEYQKSILQRLKNAGYKNPYTLAAMMATIKRESDFKPQTELSYRNTSAYRIKKIFPSKFKNWTDAQIDQLKKNDVNFFNHVYGGRYGNEQNEGYKFRGRGLNQITFKGNYEVVGAAIGKDLVTNPDQLNNLDNAVKGFAAYMEITRGYQKSAGKWPFPEIDKARSLEEAQKMLLRLNVGTNAKTDSTYYQHLKKWAPYYLKWV